MESVMRYADENNFDALVEKWNLDGSSIDDIAEEIFLNKMTIFQLAFFMVFAQKCVEKYPSKKHLVYESVFKSIFKQIKF